ncbi:MAG TPA: pitrilysin family protein, partial [Candidatus Limnocylindria bacterium]|nr:pitrilysin family protein [Candidatus Limnocylindria bacterium]
TAPLASVWCWYKVGSKDEVPGQTGVSHWCEHMNFKGTTNIPRERIKGIIEQYGGYWNGYTWIDQTTYTETATRDALDHMLFIESERMANCVYDPGDCDSERTVIISELQGGENDPDQLLDQEVTATAFRAHSYRHPTIGWLSDLESMTREDLYGYYRRFYVPNNATVVVVGDVDAEETVRAARKHFGAIEPRDIGRRPHTREPEQFGERRVVVAKEGTIAYLKLAYRAPAATEPDFFPMLVLDAVLSGAKGVSLWASFRTPPPQRSARLYQALVNTGLASSVGGALLPTQEPFLYTISLTATESTPLSALEEAVLTEIERVRAGGLTPMEVRKAKTQLRARLVFEQDSITNIAHQLGYFATIADWRYQASIPAAIERVTLDQVAEVAARRLGPASRTIGRFEPLAECTPDSARQAEPR